MDEQGFDRLAKALAKGINRRRIVKWAIAGFATGVSGGLGSASAQTCAGNGQFCGGTDHPDCCAPFQCVGPDNLWTCEPCAGNGQFCGGTDHPGCCSGYRCVGPDNLWTCEPIGGNSGSPGSGSAQQSNHEAPTIDSTETYPPNFKEPGKIVIHWHASRSWGFYNVIWRDAQTEAIGGQVKINSGGSTGSYTYAPAEPGRSYRFKVEGCDGQPFGPSDCGNWSDFTNVPAAAPLQSVRSFFAAAGVDPSGGMGMRFWLNGLPNKGNPWSLKSLLRGDYL